MFIRAGNRIISGKDNVIMVYLTEKDKKNIANMEPDCNVYCEMPDDIPEKYIARVKTIMQIFKQEVQDELNKHAEDSSDPDS